MSWWKNIRNDVEEFRTERSALHNLMVVLSISCTLGSLALLPELVIKWRNILHRAIVSYHDWVVRPVQQVLLWQEFEVSIFQLDLLFINLFLGIPIIKTLYFGMSFKSSVQEFIGTSFFGLFFVAVMFSPILGEPTVFHSIVLAVFYLLLCRAVFFEKDSILNHPSMKSVIKIQFAGMFLVPIFISVYKAVVS